MYAYHTVHLRFQKQLIRLACLMYRSGCKLEENWRACSWVQIIIIHIFIRRGYKTTASMRSCKVKSTKKLIKKLLLLSSFPAVNQVSIISTCLNTEGLIGLGEVLSWVWGDELLLHFRVLFDVFIWYILGLVCAAVVWSFFLFCNFYVSWLSFCLTSWDHVWKMFSL